MVLDPTSIAAIKTLIMSKLEKSMTILVKTAAFVWFHVMAYIKLTQNTGLVPLPGLGAD